MKRIFLRWWTPVAVCAVLFAVTPLILKPAAGRAQDDQTDSMVVDETAVDQDAVESFTPDESVADTFVPDAGSETFTPDQSGIDVAQSDSDPAGVEVFTPDQTPQETFTPDPVATAQPPTETFTPDVQASPAAQNPPPEQQPAMQKETETESQSGSATMQSPPQPPSQPQNKPQGGQGGGQTQMSGGNGEESMAAGFAAPSEPKRSAPPSAPPAAMQEERPEQPGGEEQPAFMRQQQGPQEQVGGPPQQTQPTPAVGPGISVVQNTYTNGAYPAPAESGIPSAPQPPAPTYPAPANTPQPNQGPQVTLSQIPYTGVTSDPLQTALYVGSLMIFGLAAAYLLWYYREIFWRSVARTVVAETRGEQEPSISASIQRKPRRLQARGWPPEDRMSVLQEREDQTPRIVIARS